MKKVYQVYGSEDGTLGIFSNVKKAYASAQCYVNEGDELTVKSYAQTCKELNDNGYSEVIECKHQYSCTVTRYYLNQ